MGAMHELSIAKNIIKISRENLTPEEIPRLKRINVRIGAFSTIVPEFLQSGFDAAKDGTPMENTELGIEVIPLRIKCRNCGQESEIEPIDFVCPLCLSTDVAITAGNEMTIESLEISEI